MKKLKMMLLFLTIVGVICYTGIVILFGPALHLSFTGGGTLQSQQVVWAADTLGAFVVSDNPVVQNPVTGGKGLFNLFASSLLPASILTVIAGLAAVCGQHLFRMGYSGNPPFIK